MKRTFFSAAGPDQPPLRIGLVATLSGNFTQAGKTGDGRRTAMRRSA